MGLKSFGKSLVSAGGGTSVLGTVVGAGIGGAGQYFAAKQAQRAQKEFYQNRHQWEVSDLKQAGLNPILSATTGGGSAPSVPQANIAAGMQAGINSARQAKVLNAELDTMHAAADRDGMAAHASEQAAENQRHQAHLNFMLRDKIMHDINSAQEVARHHKLQNVITARDATVAKYEKEIYDKYPGIVGAEMARRAVFGSGGIGIGLGSFFKRGPKSYTRQTSKYDRYGVYGGGSTTTYGK